MTQLITIFNKFYLHLLLIRSINCIFAGYLKISRLLKNNQKNF